MKKIVVGVEIDTKDAQGSIDALNKKLTELKENSADNTAEINELEEAINDLGKSGKSAGNDIGDSFSKLPGPLGKVGSAFNALKSGVSSLSLGFKGLAGAIAATGIGLLIIAVGTLTAYFTSNEENANKLKVIMAALGSVIGNVKDAITAVINLDFKKALSSITTELVADAKAAAGLTKNLNDVEIAQRNINEQRAETNKLIEQAKLDARDLNKSESERLEALNKVIKLEKAQTDSEVENQRKKVEALTELTKLSGTSGEDAKALSDEKIRLSELEAASIRKLTELESQKNTFIQTAQREVAAESKRIADEKAARDKAALEEEIKLAKEEAAKKLSIELQLEEERIAAMVEGQAKEEAEAELAFQRKIAKITGDSEAELEIISLLEIQRLQTLKEIKDEYRLAEEEAEQAKRDAEDKLREDDIAKSKAAEEQKKADRDAIISQSLSAASNFTSALQGLSNTLYANELANAKGNAAEEEKIRKKAFESNKAFGIIGAVISTAQAVISGFNAGASLGPAGVVMGPVMAALAAATGIAQIAAIASAKYSPSGGSSRPTTPTPPSAPAVPSAGNVGPAVSFTGSSNNLNSVGGGANQQPLVVNTNVSISESDITQTQNNVSVYESSAALSG